MDLKAQQLFGLESLLIIFDTPEQLIMTSLKTLLPDATTLGCHDASYWTGTISFVPRYLNQAHVF